MAPGKERGIYDRNYQKINADRLSPLLSDSEGMAVCEIIHTRSESEGRPERTFQLCCRYVLNDDKVHGSSLEMTLTLLFFFFWSNPQFSRHQEGLPESGPIHSQREAASAAAEDRVCAAQPAVRPVWRPATVGAQRGEARHEQSR